MIELPCKICKGPHRQDWSQIVMNAWPMGDISLAPVAPWWPGMPMPDIPNMTPMVCVPDFTNPELSELSELKIDSAKLAETEVPWGLEKDGAVFLDMDQ